MHKPAITQTPFTMYLLTVGVHALTMPANPFLKHKSSAYWKPLVGRHPVLVINLGVL